jgi:hypothetical protein
MARKPIAQGIGKLIKQGLRKAYQGKTAPLQAGSKIANRLAPNSKVAATLAALASPSILNSNSRPPAPTNQNTPKEIVPLKLQQKEFKAMQPTEERYTARKRTGSKIGRVGKRNSPGNAIDASFDFNIPGQDISPASMRQGPIRGMKAGGLAIKGQGKAFLNSKR